MSTVRSFSIIFATAFMCACTGYNSTDIDDKNAGNERVYGDVGGPARQLAQEYPDNPEAAEAAGVIRAKWWPEKGQEQEMDTISLQEIMDEDGNYDDVNVDTSANTIDTTNNTQNPDHDPAGEQGQRESVGSSNKKVD